MNERIVDLEVRCAYHERQLADLDEVVQAMAKRIDLLERELVQLRKSASARAEPDGGTDEPPPHY